MELGFDDPTITVIVPAFNVENYISLAIDSILQQSIPPNEIIIVNDGSTDSTPLILNQYGQKYELKIFNTINNGLGYARNLGRALAKSEYIYFFDSDDILEDNFIKKMRNMILEYNRPDLILFAGKTFLDDSFEGQINNQKHIDPLSYQRNIKGVFYPGDQLLTKLINSKSQSPSACLYLSKSNLWSRNRISFPSIIHEDEAVFFPIIASSDSIVVTHEALFHRRKRVDSIMTSEKNNQYAYGLLSVLNKTQEFMLKNPESVSSELSVWRNRIKELTLRYIALCRETDTRIAWSQVVSAIITAKSLVLILKVTYYSLPYKIQVTTTRIKKLIIN